MEEAAWFWGVATCVKLLLIPTYHSTDFEVHRHWLALTSSLPLARWYSDASSPWTLDYPPLFAYFELLLSLPASLLDPTIVDLVAGQNYATPFAILFQRLSVAAADLVLFLAAHRLARRFPPFRRRLAYALLLWSPALLIVDHIHFQYNGFLLGILLLSLSFLVEGRDLAGGIAFAVLICSKHLFLVGAPVYFVYLLRHYCKGGFGNALGRFLAMGSAVGAVFAAAFGPFWYHGQVNKPIVFVFPLFSFCYLFLNSLLTLCLLLVS